MTNNIYDRQASEAITISQPSLLSHCDAPPAGYVSSRCRFVDDGPQRLVLVNGTATYCYDLCDQLAARQIWTMVYENGLATYCEIAHATEIARRSLQYWVKRYREEGVSGLADRDRCGAPRKVTDAVRRKIMLLRERRLKLNEIAQRCQISARAVSRVLTEAKQAAKARQQQLALDAGDLDRGDTAAVDAGKQPDSAVSLDAPTASSAEASTECLGEISWSEPNECRDDEVEAAMAADRSLDRMAASHGKLQDAEPLFTPCENAEFAGGFLAVAVLASDPFLDLGRQTYGNFHSAFYGVRTLLVTLILMALLRIKRPEHLRRLNPAKLGRILGLDRAPEVKSLRRILRMISKANKATEFMRDVAKARTGSLAEPVKTVHVDGHVLVYSGKEKIGEVFSSRCSKVGKGQTDNWVNLPGRYPLLAIASDFNEGLNRVLPRVLSEARLATGTKALRCCFDRGGSDVGMFEQLLQGGYQILTYRKGAYDDVPVSEFRCEQTVINGRKYDFAPYERYIVLPVYEQIDHGQNRKFTRRNTGRTVKLREIRILREDGGQTAILSSESAEELSAVEAAGIIFDRIGSQENIFKYMRAEFELDGLTCYGTEEISASLTHPNPNYTKLEKQASKLRDRRNRLFGKYADRLTGLDGETAVECLRQLRHEFTGEAAGKAGGERRVWNKKASKVNKDSKMLAELNLKLSEIAAEMAKTPAREPVAAAGYKRLKSELRTFINTVKISAYHIETELVDLIADHYRNTANEGRSVVAAALRSSGILRLEPGRLVIKLEPQSEPRRTRAVNELGAALTRRHVRYPGSHRVMVFEPAPVPDPSESLGFAIAPKSAK